MDGKAQRVCHEIHSRNLLTWSSLISSFTQQGKAHEALTCFEQMQSDGTSPDVGTLVCILKACGSLRAVDKGKEVHYDLIKKGLLDDNIVLGNALIDMYVKCGMLSKARQVHEKLPIRNVVSWSSLIVGYAQQERGHEALNLFEQMQREGLRPNAITFSCILKACGSIGAIDKGTEVHKKVLKSCLLDNDIVLGNALVDMYAKCGMLAKAQEVHDDLRIRNVVSWNALIAGYAQQGQGHKALNCLEHMKNQGLSPDAITFVCSLKSCGAIKDLDKGKCIHDEIISRDFLKNNIMLGTTLVDMYVKCGDIVMAHKVLEELPVRNKVSWSVLIAGYVEAGHGHKALICFERMQSENFFPDEITFVCILKACGHIGAIDKGKKFHNEIINRGLIGDNIVVGTALVDMYAKCGALPKAQEVLEDLPVRNVVSWSALIAGYAQHGQGHEALKCLERMERDGLSPNSVTFLCVLTACSHTGLMNEAETYYLDMSNRYGVLPSIEHHTCMVMIYGCSGQFDKALSVIKTSESFHCHPVWVALLAACKKWANVKLGRVAFDHTIQLDNTCAAVYVLMASIYLVAGMQEDAQRVEVMRKKLNFCKKPGDNAWVDASEHSYIFYG